MAKRKNKKKNIDGFIFPVPFAMVVIAASTLALAYVWIGCRCQVVGKQLKALELQEEELSRALVNEEYRWARMKSPENLEKKMNEMGIKMTWPRPDQIVRLHIDRNDAPEDSRMPSGALVHVPISRAVLNE